MDRGITSTAPTSVRPTSLAPDHPELTKKEVVVRDIGEAIRRLGLWRSTFGRWVRRVLQLDRRYGVRFNAAGEKSGFYTYRAAKHWAESQTPRVENYVVYHYDAIDMWMPGIERREHAVSSLPPPEK